ncbi:MAG: hypothetical protein M1365_08770, partial [Actinobacteria bacterium]|nr:hypothetical protein [Actinomycetota bacterium]
MYAKRLQKLGIFKINDFLYHKPFRYEDYSLISKISKLQEGEIVTVQGIVEEMKNEFTKRYKKIQKAKVKDSTGVLDIIWFNQPFLTKYIRKGDKISLSGKIEKNGNQLIMQSPLYEILSNDLVPLHTGRIIPIYPETKGVSSKWLRRQIYKILMDENHSLEEFLPKSIINKHNFPELKQAIEKLHFPKEMEEIKKAKERLSFQEIFLMQLGGILRRNEWKKQINGIPFKISTFKKKIDAFIKTLPFKLTRAQESEVFLLPV